MPARQPSRWTTPDGQKIVSRYDSKEITRDEAIDLGHKKLAFDTRTNAARAFTQYLKYRADPNRALRGRGRLGGKRIGHKVKPTGPQVEVEITPELVERVVQKFRLENEELKKQKQVLNDRIALHEDNVRLRQEVAEKNQFIERITADKTKHSLSVAAGNVPPD